METPEAATGDELGGPRSAGTRARGARSSTTVLLAVAALLLAVAIAVVLWLVLRGNGGTAPHGRATKPAAASADRLVAVARSIGHPIYWVGPRSTYHYELSRTKDGRVYIRYLSRGVKLGSRSPNYLTVGTYPQRHALATLRAAAKAQRVQTIPVAGGGLAFQYKTRPTSVYLAYPGSDYQVEVFDPSPARALELVSTGQVTAVGAAPSRAASQAATVEHLKSVGAALGHPVYWAGAQTGATYELTKTKDGRVYIRYLPAGVQVGDRRPNYLTVGTYPQRNAFATLKATAARTHVATLQVAGGGLALVDEKHPTSVYLAYPHVDLQVEVFDPSPNRARRLVASGRIAPVR